MWCHHRDGILQTLLPRFWTLKWPRWLGEKHQHPATPAFFWLGSSWKQGLVLNIFTISRPGTSDFVIWELWCGWPEEFDCEKKCFDWGCSWGPCGESQARGCEAVEQLRTWKGEVEWHRHVQKPGDSPKLGLRAPKVNPEVCPRWTMEADATSATRHDKRRRRVWLTSRSLWSVGLFENWIYNPKSNGSRIYHHSPTIFPWYRHYIHKNNGFWGVVSNDGYTSYDRWLTCPVGGYLMMIGILILIKSYKPDGARGYSFI